MSDSYGDGWSGTILYIGDYTFSLASGSSGTESVCLEAGTYTPYACGGTSIDEVSWSVGLVSGDVDCSGSSTFVVGVAAAANDDYRCIISGFFALFSGCLFIFYMYLPSSWSSHSALSSSYNPAHRTRRVPAALLGLMQQKWGKMLLLLALTLMVRPLLLEILKHRGFPHYYNTFLSLGDGDVDCVLGFEMATLSPLSTQQALRQHIPSK
jgi:hypothetical protein